MITPAIRCHTLILTLIVTSQRFDLQLGHVECLLNFINISIDSDLVDFVPLAMSDLPVPCPFCLVRVAEALRFVQFTEHHVRARVALDSTRLRESIVNHKWMIKETYSSVAFSVGAYHRVSFILVT